MTRTEFCENVTTWGELLVFCSVRGCDDIVEDVYSDDDKNERINNHLVGMAQDVDRWQDLCDMLNNIPTGYDYYIEDEYGEFRDADEEDFDNYKCVVLTWADENDVWEPEEDDDEEEPVDVEEGCSIGELFSAGVSCLRAIKIEENKARQREENDLQSLFSVAG